jgi:signal transduction histidine kinase
MAAALAAVFVLSLTAFAQAMNDYAYDFLFRLLPPPAWNPDSIILAIDEPTLTKYAGVAGIRNALAAGLERIAPAKPAAVAIDVVLADDSPIPGTDEALERSLSATQKPILACELLGGASAVPRWEEPIPRFRIHAAALGEVHADISKYDAISRDVPLEKAAGHDRRWILALAAYAVAKDLKIEESPDDLTVGNIRIPSRRRDGRTMRIQYSRTGIPQISLADLDRNPALAARFAGKTVFFGTTAQTAMRDRWMTPLSNGTAMSGIEINANVYETIAHGLFLTDTPLVSVALFCIALAVCSACIFVFTSGWTAYILALIPLLASQVIPAAAFAGSRVWPWLPGTLAAVATVAVAAAWKQVRGRRELLASEQQKTAYQHAIQFVTHEMRTPLTAIQGSSELIGRYATMPEAKRQQMAQLINSESKRLSRMIEAFLSVERLSAGQMELKQERFALPGLVSACADRARPIAERKRISIELLDIPVQELTGDRELMEYAVYNLLTNAVKYSPPETCVTVYGDIRDHEVWLSVRDQGIGMDRKEVGRIFEKFYRTRRAEQSGETGTGIGLSIVEQIVTQHGGRIQVVSEPGKGSEFTVILKQAA